MIVDAHLHVWDPTRAPYPWLTSALHPIDRTLLIDDIAADLDHAGVDRVVLVQAADNAADTELMRSEARRHPRRVAGIVAWLPLDDPAALERGIESFAGDPLIVGIRNLIHDREPGWLSGSAQNHALALLAQAGLALDFVTSSAEALGEIPGLAGRHPALRIVIDHLGKPPIGGTAQERLRWRGLLRDAAAHPLVHAKLSGLYPPQGDATAWSVDDIRPFIDDAVEILGPARLMYGSDWPIVVRAGGHHRAHAALTEIIGGWDAADRDAALGGTASAFYRLPSPPTIERTTA